MEFQVRLATESGLPLSTVLEMELDEINLRLAYLGKNGSPWQRLEHILAVGLTATANSMGAKLKPQDLLPRSTEERAVKVVSAKVGMRMMARWLGRKVKHGR